MAAASRRLPGSPAHTRLCRAEVVAGRRYRDGRGPEAGDEGLDSGRLPFPDRLCQRRRQKRPRPSQALGAPRADDGGKRPATGWRCEVATRLGYTFMMGRMSEYQPEELVAVILGRYDEVDGKPVYSDFSDVTRFCERRLAADGHPGRGLDPLYLHQKAGDGRKRQRLHLFPREGFGQNPPGTPSMSPIMPTIRRISARPSRIFSRMSRAFTTCRAITPSGWSKSATRCRCPGRTGSGRNSTAAPQAGKRPPSRHSSIIAAAVRARSATTIWTSTPASTRGTSPASWGTGAPPTASEYIGHVLEDNGLHSRLGPGTGHYFRAMRGQHMAGIDVVLNQLLPDKDKGIGAFYHYAIAQLAVSAAHQNPWMKGRALCEIFGAFGWSVRADDDEVDGRPYVGERHQHLHPPRLHRKSLPRPRLPRPTSTPTG